MCRKMDCNAPSFSMQQNDHEVNNIDWMLLHSQIRSIVNPQHRKTLPPPAKATKETTTTIPNLNHRHRHHHHSKTSF